MSSERADHSGLIITLTIAIGGVLLLGMVAAGLLFFSRASMAPMPMASPAQTVAVSSSGFQSTMIEARVLKKIHFDDLVVGDWVLLGPRILHVQAVQDGMLTAEYVGQGAFFGADMLSLELVEARELLSIGRQECNVQELSRLPSDLEWFFVQDPVGASSAVTTAPAVSVPETAPDPTQLPAEAE